MKKELIKQLPAFTGYRPRKNVIGQFVFDYEPAGIKESRRFRQQLVRVLNAGRGARWVEAKP